MSAEIILYTSPAGHKRVAVYYQGETFWLTQKQLADLFEVEVQTINYHLKEIFKSGELQENSVIRKIRITADDGKDYLTNCYNLDAIISVGYRVNSEQATRFRVPRLQTASEVFRLRKSCLGRAAVDGSNNGVEPRKRDTAQA